jgi:malate synthase
MEALRFEPARDEFDAALGGRPNQIDRQRQDVEVSSSDLLDVASTPAAITAERLRNDVSVGFRTSRSGSAGAARRRSTTHGGRGHSGDLALAAVEWIHHGATLEGPTTRARSSSASRSARTSPSS